MVEIHQFHKVKVIFPTAAEGDFDAVADLVIVLVVGGCQIRCAEITAEVTGDLLPLLSGYSRIQTRQSLPQHQREHALLFIAPSRTVRQHVDLIRRRITADDIV